MRHQRSSTLQPHCQESQSEERLLRGHLAWLLLWIQVSKGITIGNLGKEVRFGLQDLGVTCPQAREEGGGEGRENTQSEMRGGSWQLVLLLRNMRVKMMGMEYFFYCTDQKVQSLVDGFSHSPSQDLYHLCYLEERYFLPLLDGFYFHFSSMMKRHILFFFTFFPFLFLFPSLVLLCCSSWPFTSRPSDLTSAS